MSYHPEAEASATGNHPWYKINYPYAQNVIGLHQEIEHFYEYMSPTQIEHCIRGELIQRIEDIVVSLWPLAQVQLYGSFRTGLYLPTSDINLTVIGNWAYLPLKTLEQEFIVRGLAEKDRIIVLEDAHLARLKVLDKKTQLKVEICFNICEGIKAAELIKHFIRKFPTLPKLILVLKQFLIIKGLHGTSVGGLSSYGLTLMCINYLQSHYGSTEQLRDANLGVLLMELLEFYGRNFDFMGAAIRLNNGGRYTTREELQIFPRCNYRRSLLCIEDPVLPTNDVGKDSYRFLDVKWAFDYAFTALTHAVHPISFVNNVTIPSILGYIVHVTDETIMYRRWIKQQFSQLRSPFVESPPLQLSESAGTSRSHRSNISSDSTSSVNDAATSEVSGVAAYVASTNNVRQLPSQEPQPPK